MRLRLATATWALAEHGLAAPDVGPLSGVLLRPFLDLTGDGGPINARVVAYAGQSLLSPETAPGWLPPQSNTKSLLRRSLIRETGQFGYDVSWPADLPDALAGPQWQALCEEVARFPVLPPERRYRAVCVLYKLGLFTAAAELAGVPGPDQLAADDFAGLTLLRAAGALSKSGHSTHSVTPYAVSVFEASPRGGRARLAAAINLAIHYARATRETDATVSWAEQVHVEMEHLRPEERPADELMRSIALRAASFGPFVRRDRAGVTRILDAAEASARQVLSSDDVPRVLAEENLYAVLETRTNEAVAFGDRSAAAGYAAAVVDHDPLEPKAWMQLGAVHWDDRRTEESLAAYRTAATLGAPFTATSWYCVARCLERLDDLEEACHAYGVSVSAEPLGLTALLGLRRTALRTGEKPLADWAGQRLEHLHRHATSTPAEEG
ncbi:hypothetical protein ACWEPC_22400 [Nonomuraea sp. NPDC004297]